VFDVDGDAGGEFVEGFEELPALDGTRGEVAAAGFGLGIVVPDGERVVRAGTELGDAGYGCPGDFVLDGEEGALAKGFRIDLPIEEVGAEQRDESEEASGGHADEADAVGAETEVATEGGEDLKGPQEQPKPPIQPKFCVESHGESIVAKNGIDKINLFAQEKKSVGKWGGWV
jgi:hypothetical protein